MEKSRICYIRGNIVEKEGQFINCADHRCNSCKYIADYIEESDRDVVGQYMLD